MIEINSDCLNLNIHGSKNQNQFEAYSDVESLLLSFEVINTNSRVKYQTQKTTALQIYLEDAHWKIPKTFIPSLDLLLNEQIRPNLITEITGYPGTGKTQLCYHLLLGIEDGALLITTNKNFAPHRLRALAVQYIGNANQALQRIYVLEATNCDEIQRKLESLDQFFAVNKISLIIVDSIAWPLRQQVTVKRATSFCVLAQLLRSIANLNKCSIVLVNDLTVDITNSFNCSSFGHSFYHIINNRILLYKVNDVIRRAKLLKSVISNYTKDSVFDI